MATFYGAEYSDAFVEVPSSKIQPGKHAGSSKYEYFSFAVPQAVLGANDIIKLCKIPAGAIVVDAVLQFPDQGSTGTAELGWAAAGSIEAADADGLLTTVDMKAAADCVSMQQQMEAGGTNAGFLKQFAAEVDVQLLITEATDAGTGTIKGYVKYLKP